VYTSMCLSCAHNNNPLTHRHYHLWRHRAICLTRGASSTAYILSHIDPTATDSPLRTTRARAAAVARLTYLATFHATLISATYRMLRTYTAPAP
jgi:hypothetical protein